MEGGQTFLNTYPEPTMASVVPMMIDAGRGIVTYLPERECRVDRY